MSDKIKRDIIVKFRATPEEYDLICAKADLAGINNLSTYIRKMAIDGYVVKLELPELREMISLLRRSGNNLNQIARRVNATGRVYEKDLADIASRQQELWQSANNILSKLTAIG